MLDTLASLGEFFGGMAVIGGVIFAVIQVRHHRQQRRDIAAMELMHAVLGRHFVEAFRLLGSVPDGISASQLRAKGHEYEGAALTSFLMFETIGLLVFRGVAPFDLVRELTGGAVIALWRKLSAYFEEIRVERSHERIAEWFQWLAERLEEQEAKAATRPAHERFAAWKPRN
ncbi:MAG: DUF4760 domain-containing protein [Gemmatimonadetes bacterium]|nr:DUF4760 domain-containing protein [Gemmatimonadota bacterium]NIO32299.1 DUF4760 domain-containing protein [Gemmatimonadota bacterium]